MPTTTFDPNGIPSDDQLKENLSYATALGIGRMGGEIERLKSIIEAQSASMETARETYEKNYVALQDKLIREMNVTTEVLDRIAHLAVNLRHTERKTRDAEKVSRETADDLREILKLIRQPNG